MPHIYVEPEQFLHYKGVTIFHTYRNGNGNDPKMFHYRTDNEEDDKYIFDVRELPPVEGMDANDVKDHKTIIKSAIDQKALPLPEDVEYNPDDTEEKSPEQLLTEEFQVPLVLRRKDIAAIFNAEHALAMDNGKIEDIAGKMAERIKNERMVWEPALIVAIQDVETSRLELSRESDDATLLN